MNNDFKQASLEVLPTLPWVATEEYLVDVMFEGSPQENESDTCIAELVDLGPAEEEHTCIITQECDDIIMDMDKPCHGYPLTHKLSNVILPGRLRQSFYFGRSAIWIHLTNKSSVLVEVPFLFICQLLL